MPERRAFSYAVVRVVPHVERQEFLNSGVIVFCDAAHYLAAAIELDPVRLLALAPDADVALVAKHLASIPLICTGSADGGPIACLPPRERWHWLVAPRSTVIQTAPAHGGMAVRPEDELERLMVRMVRSPSARRRP